MRALSPRVVTGSGKDDCAGTEAQFTALRYFTLDGITWAAITLMTRRITRRSSRRAGQPPSHEAQRD